MRKVDFELARWIDEQGNFNVFATVTFKQALMIGGGHIVRNTRENIDATCGVIRDRVYKKLKRVKTPFPWIATIETGGGEKRIHAHMAMQVPSEIEFHEFQDAFHDICGRMDWVHDRIEVTPIVDEDGERGSRKVIFLHVEGRRRCIGIQCVIIAFLISGALYRTLTFEAAATGQSVALPCCSLLAKSQ